MTCSLFQVFVLERPPLRGLYDFSPRMKAKKQEVRARCTRYRGDDSAREPAGDARSSPLLASLPHHKGPIHTPHVPLGTVPLDGVTDAGLPGAIGR